MTELYNDGVLYCSILLPTKDVTRLVKMGLFEPDKAGRMRLVQLSGKKEQRIADIITDSTD